MLINSAGLHNFRGFDFFGETLLQDITVAHLKRYRSHQLSCKNVAIVEKDGQKERIEKTISPGTVSRELNSNTIWKVIR
jgi:hypothetical protein